MRKALSLLVLGSVVLAPLSVSAQATSTGSATSTGTTMSGTTVLPASNTGAVTAKSTSLGEYKEVSCSTQAIFGQNGCNQCFTGKAVKVGERLTGLFDNWQNNGSNVLIAVKDEQKTPSMVAVGSTWTPTSADESKMWINGSEIIWSPSATSGKEEFNLMPGQEVKFMQTDLGAGFTLEKTTKKHGDVVGLLKYPIVYRTMNLDSTTRSTAAETHYECVTYTLDKPDLPPPPPKKEVPPPTTVKTGPTETLALIIAAFFIAFGLMISLRKRN